MNRSGLRALPDWLGWAAAHVGPPGRIGVALMALAAFSCVFLVKPLETELRDTRARADRIARDSASRPAARADLERDWLTSLPASHEGHAHLARLFGAAESAGLRLEEGRYRESRDTGSGLTKLSIALPVNGAYPAIRAFLALALAREPGLALEGARLSRDGLGEREIRGELRFALYLGSKP